MTESGGYVAMVRPRWSDMDVFGHVNHANVVTLLEQARVPLLFREAAAAGLLEFAKGIVVVRLSADYRSPIVATDADVRIAVSLRDLKFASFTLGYKVHAGPSDMDKVAVEAETVLAPYDLAASRPRRLTEPERTFLTVHLVGQQIDA